MFKFEQAISKEIYEKKYQGKDKDAIDTFSRVAKDISSVEKDKKKREKWERRFFDVMVEGKFIPAGRIMANAGTEMKYYNNCYVIGIDDSMEDIYRALQNDAIISKCGGGVGVDISKLRPKDAKLSRGGVSSGPISFLEVFNSSAKIIQTGGGRRAAHIALMDISHPDIEEFISCKQGDNNKKLTQFNISVKITDKFMDCVKKNKNWDLTFNGKKHKTVKAKELFNKLMKNAFEHNEPGVLFVDTVNKYNNGFYDFRLDAVNPCGESPLENHGICCLGSLNLTSFVKDAFEENSYFDIKEFSKVVKIGIRFLDNVLDKTKYPLPEIKDNSMNVRRIGLGFTGLADMFAMLGITYGSDMSKVLSNKIGEALRNNAYRTSVELAKEKGKMPVFDKKILGSNFIKKVPKDIISDIKKYGLRNIATMSIAPTGTISLAFGNNCSSGIEPIFQLEYERQVRTKGDNKKKSKVKDYAWMLYESKMETIGEPPEFFNTTFEIKPKDQIEIQSIFQKYIDQSISKTVNLSEEISFEEYKDIYTYAYEKELKGFTSFNPSGCGSLDTKILTEKGVMSFLELLKHQNYSEIDILTNTPKWLPINKKLNVYNENGDLVSIKNLFINGVDAVYKITMDNNKSYYLTKEHKLKLKNGDYCKVGDLKKGDDILSVNIK